MIIPAELLYSKDHLWIRINDTKCVIGLTDYGQELIGTISFIELPGASSIVKKNEKLASIEGIKSVIDILSPFDAEVERVNESLKTHPEIINTSPYSEGWIAELAFKDNFDKISKLRRENQGLLSASEYQSLIKG